VPVLTDPQAIAAGVVKTGDTSDLTVVNEFDDKVSSLVDKLITVTGVAPSIREGQSLNSATIASFIDTDAGFDVLGSHSSQHAGDKTLSVVVTDIGPTTGTAPTMASTTAISTVTVRNARLAVAGGSIEPVEGHGFGGPTGGHTTGHHHYAPAPAIPLAAAWTRAQQNGHHA
jgi:hypothetical protein